jgi:RNA polymerase sigma-70 factor (ECF subfamily)
MTGPEKNQAAPGAPGPDGPSDGSLLRRVRHGTTDAATALYFRYADHLLAVASARLAPDLAVRVGPEDVVQSVFRTFFRRAALGQFEVPDGGDLWKLFLVLALNKIRSAGTRHRAARRDVRRTPQASAEAPTPDGPGPANETALTVLRLTVEEVLDRLPPAYRTVVERRIEGYEVDEIARLVGRSKRSVERLLRDLRDQLGAALEEEA